jgi:hypothetical protein
MNDADALSLTCAFPEQLLTKPTLSTAKGMVLPAFCLVCSTTRAQQVTTLTTNQGNPGNLVVDSSRVYWLDHQN